MKNNKKITNKKKIKIVLINKIYIKLNKYKKKQIFFSNIPPKIPKEIIKQKIKAKGISKLDQRLYYVCMKYFQQ